MGACQYYLLCYVVGYYMATMSISQKVFFGLKEIGSEDQALFGTERDVTITCNVTCVADASIEIFSIDEITGIRPIINLKPSNQTRNSVEYVLHTVPRGLKFKCLVKYNDSTNGSEHAKEVFWFPHIIRETDPVYCRRNGTVSQPYQTGDKLLLECFCNLNLTASCKWISSTNGTALPNALVDVYADYTVYRVVVGPIPAADESTAYICQPSDHSSDTQSCIIQPMSFSSFDYVYNPISSPGCEPFVSFTVTGMAITQLQVFSTTNGNNFVSSSTDTPPTVNSLLLIGFIASVGIIAILIVAIVMIILYYKNRSQRHPRGLKIQESRTTRDNLSDVQQFGNHSYETPDQAQGEQPRSSNASPHPPVYYSRSLNQKSHRDDVNYNQYERNLPIEDTSIHNYSYVDRDT